MRNHTVGCLNMLFSSCFSSQPHRMECTSLLHSRALGHLEVVSVQINTVCANSMPWIRSLWGCLSPRFKMFSSEVCEALIWHDWLLSAPSQRQIYFISLIKAQRKLSFKVILSPFCHLMHLHTSQLCSVCPDSQENQYEWTNKHGVYLQRDKHMWADSSSHFWQRHI